VSDPLTKRLDARIAAGAKRTDLLAALTGLANHARRAADDERADPRAALRAIADHAERVVEIHRPRAT